MSLEGGMGKGEKKDNTRTIEADAGKAAGGTQKETMPWRK